MLENLNLRNGEITFNDLIYIKQDVPLIEQLDHLKEDLLQIEVNKKFVVDVGFYPEFSAEGEFLIMLVKGFDWDEPVWSTKSREISLLPKLIQEAIDKAF